MRLSVSGTILDHDSLGNQGWEMLQSALCTFLSRSQHQDDSRKGGDRVGAAWAVLTYKSKYKKVGVLPI